MTAPAQPWREALELYIRDNAKPVEKYGHQPRLYALTQVIGTDLTYDDDVVYAAAWLHDIGVFHGHRPEERQALECWDSVAYAIDIAPKILTSIGFPPQRIKAVLECIRHHQPSAEPKSLESTILRDADILEQLGAIGILRSVSKIGRDTRFQTFTQAIASLQAAFDRLPALLRLAAARRLAEERIRVHREFLQATASESNEHLH